MPSEPTVDVFVLRWHPHTGIVLCAYIRTQAVFSLSHLVFQIELTLWWPCDACPLFHFPYTNAFNVEIGEAERPPLVEARCRKATQQEA